MARRITTTHRFDQLHQAMKDGETEFAKKLYWYLARDERYACYVHFRYKRYSFRLRDLLVKWAIMGFRPTEEEVEHGSLPDKEKTHYAKHGLDTRHYRGDRTKSIIFYDKPARQKNED